jgi:hypothetical protein
VGCSYPKQTNLTLYPWVMVCVDLVGLLTIRIQDKTHSLQALTICIEAKSGISHNPQAHAIIERVHKVVNDMLGSFDLENNNENIEKEENNPSD